MSIFNVSRASLSLALLAAFAVGCSSATPSDDADENAGAAQTTEPTEVRADDTVQLPRGSHVGVHGLNLFGSERFYISHIPLYSNPHNLQVIAEVKIASGVPEGQAQFGTKNFTIRPSSFSLGDLAQGTLRSITGTIFLGNFESGGSQAFRNVKFDVVRVIFARQMSSSMPRNANLEYIAVGTPTQSYLVHLIDAPPSFEHIVNVKLQDSWLAASALEQGTLVRITNGSNVVGKRLKAQTTVTGIVPGPITSGGESGPTTGGGTSSSGSTDPQPVPASIQVLGENACLPGTDFYGNCPAAQ